MTDIILHHYPESPFSEKIRLLLGYKGVDYDSVVIPMIMPKPDLMPLTGGYRKTPVMQIGADVYCDTAIIAKVIDRLHPGKPIYPEASLAASGMIAHWADTFFFKVCVAVAFQPRAMANNPVLSNPQQAQAFAADRAELTKGSTELRMPFEIARPYFVQQLAR
ncbi:MAG TPA: glutathione S-transferase, partial [Pseudomonadales bacterium]|nr:glutathione S-transferase [Pseudomonadales bacterium]